MTIGVFGWQCEKCGAVIAAHTAHICNNMLDSELGATNDRLRAILARGADLMPLDDTVTMTSRADWKDKVREELVRI